MMDNYIKRLESVISPNSYNINNYKEKIFDNKGNITRGEPFVHNSNSNNLNNNIQNNQGFGNLINSNGNFNNLNNRNNSFQPIPNSINDFSNQNPGNNKNNIVTFNNNFNNMNSNMNNDNNNPMEFQLNLNKNNLHSEENKKLIEEYIQRMGIKDLLESASSNPNIINESKMRIYQKILEREGKLENPEDFINNYAENEIMHLQNLYNNNNNENINNEGNFQNQPNDNSINANFREVNNNNNYNSDLINNLNFNNTSNFNSINNNNNINKNTNNSNLNNTNNFSNIHKKNFTSMSNNNMNISNNNINNVSNSQSRKDKNNISMSPTHKNKHLSYASEVSQNVNTEREKIHMLNIKAMNYRHEVETLKKRICELNKVIEDQKEKILRMEKQKENDNKYLIKLENLLAAQSSGQPLSLNAYLNNNLNNNINSNNVSSLSNLSQRNFTNGIYVELKKCSNLIIKDKVNNFALNLTEPTEMKEFILNLMNEAQKLKAFQKQVFEISKSYDDVNDNIINSIKTIQNILDISSAKTIDDIQKKEIYSNFEKISENVNKTLELKQNEFNFLIDAKDQEIKLLSEEVFKINDDLEKLKRDRIRDQKLLDDFETQNNFLSTRIKEINDKFIDGLGLQVAQKEKESQQTSMMIEKKVAPIKQSLNTTAKKIENMFDMQDKSNVKLLSSINKNIKC